MADIDTSQGSGNKKHKGGVRSKKMSTRVDLTPMVDLAFLLITFFMLTTQLSKSVAMDLNMPKPPENDEEKQTVKESKVLNLILDKDNKIWYYNGTTVVGLKTTDFSPEGLRDIIYKKQKEVDAKFGKDKDGDTETIVLIKYTKDANYKNLVDVLDEMDITKTKIYSIQDLSDIEQEAVDNGGTVTTFAD
ncbi:MAG: biopolymer transporter ExbD [Chitinophagales bacterium]|nr:biopolymer transporter ExbD [Chitinophagales bacterium]